MISVKSFTVTKLTVEDDEGNSVLLNALDDSKYFVRGSSLSLFFIFSFFINELWLIFLCRYGIIYVNNKGGRKRIIKYIEYPKEKLEKTKQE